MKIAHLRDIEAAERAQPDPFGAHASTFELIRAAAERDPAAPALSFFARTEDHATPARWTYGEWLSDLTRTANLLRHLGVQRGDVVALVLPNLPETHLMLWGAETTGIAFAVNPLLEGAQMAELLRAAQARWIVTTGPKLEAEIWGRVAAALKCLGDGHRVLGILAVDVARHTPGQAKGTMRQGRAQELPESCSGVPVLDFHSELAQTTGAALEFEVPGAQDIASYLCTGGTTGLPKIAVHNHRNETAICVQLGVVAGSHFLAPGSTVLTALPLFHCNAQLATGLAVFAHGGHVLLGPPAGYRAPGLVARFWEIVAQHRVAAFMGVPTVFAGLLQAPRAGHDLSNLRTAICGAAPMPVELFRCFEAETGVKILEGYGLTESAAVCSLSPADGESRIGSVGLRLPWQEMRALVLDGEGRYLRDTAANEVGVIALRGPNVFAGYLDPGHDAEAWVDRKQDGAVQRWLNTGDLGRQDKDGYFWLTGRKKELIIRGGHNIDPKTVEEALLTHPDVALCAVVGRPDAHAGEVPVAYVQLRPGRSAEEGELLQFAEAHIGERAAIPKAVVVLSGLPLTAVGKIFKPSLVMREVEGVVRAEARAAAVELVELTVRQEAGTGIVARFRTQGDDSALAQALGNYTFASRSISRA